MDTNRSAIAKAPGAPLLVLPLPPYKCLPIYSSISAITLFIIIFFSLSFCQIVCPACSDSGKKSNVFYKGASCTLVFCGNGYYDTIGIFHPSEPCNTLTEYYECSNGHKFEIKSKR